MFPKTVTARLRRRVLPFVVLGLAAACAEIPEPEAAVTAPPPLPVMAWDHRPESAEWTDATLKALRSHGAPLLTEVPVDIGDWCPGYAEASQEERAAFWAGMFSALAKHESTWNPAAVGGGGRWFGLVQIAPATARSYGCAAGSGSALQDGVANLSCAVRIAARTVLRDNAVSAGMRGLAADWGPFHSSRKREEMRQWTRSQSYCQPGAAES
ncbi:transglycosylase SLT domain-containing protein [Limimaricola pyoseonensis]|uniref:Transglycosylase SLT domain-containing protein n=1 Tax=Limimaricola pyoseonensis TaxID=521013 RepID=A0A1G7DKN2_9RHOB|nr:transglycosylase SLT domain-containing protein [Limimaricola pyoseonensis]SDE52059.1 Transglycosylase SLT domain-containing protein [Limimaricola pyoseonensis]